MIFRKQLNFLEALLLLLLAISTGFASRNYKTRVELESSWAETPLIAEVAEFMADGNTARFWEFLDQLDRDHLATLTTSDILPLLEKFLLRPLELKLAMMMIGSRAYSPMVEMNNALARVCLPNSANSTTEASCRHPCPGAAVFAQIGTSRYACNFKDFVHAMKSGEKFTAPVGLLTKDKVRGELPSEKKPRVQIFIYADLTMKEFGEWHTVATDCAQHQSCTYVFRHNTRPGSKKTPLHGYGVELVLKSTEYKAMDDTQQQHQDMDLILTEDNSVVSGFNFTRLLELHPDKRADLLALHRDQLGSDIELKPLKKWQMRQLGLQACQAVMDSPDPLEALKDISQNFPSRTNKLVSIAPRKDLIQFFKQVHEDLADKLQVGPGSNRLFINSVEIPLDTDIFALMDFLRQEVALIESLSSLGLNETEKSLVLSLNKKEPEVHVDPNYSMMGVPSTLAKLSTLPSMAYTGEWALDLRLAPIAYINCLKKDEVYTQWSDSIRSLFQPNYFGSSMRQIAQNYFNLVLLVDPLETQAQAWIKMAEAFLINRFPLRIGLIMMPHPKSPPVNHLLARVFHFLSQMDTEKAQNIIKRGTHTAFMRSKHLGSLAGLALLTDVYAVIARERKRDPNYQVTWDDLSAFVMRELGPHLAKEELAELLAKDQPPFSSSREFLGQVGLLDLITETSSSDKDQQTFYNPMMIFNGHVIGHRQVTKSGGFEDTVLLAVNDYTNFLQISYLQKRISDGGHLTDLQKANKFLLSRYNKDILQTSGQPWTYANAANFNEDLAYLQKGDEVKRVRQLTIWVVFSDFNTDRDLIQAALDYLTSQSSPDVRLSFVWNANSQAKRGADEFFNRALAVVGHAGDQNLSAGRNFLRKLLKADKASVKELAVSGMDVDKFQAQLTHYDQSRHEHLCRYILKIDPGQRAVVVNGRVFVGARAWTKDDFKLTEMLSLGQSTADELAELLSQKSGKITRWNWLEASDRIWQITSILQQNQHSTALFDDAHQSSVFGREAKPLKRVNLHALHGLPKAVSFQDRLTGAADWDIFVVINPASREAQKLSDWLLVLRDNLHVNIRVLLNPQLTLSELPIKNFYRFVWQPTQDRAKKLNLKPQARFEHLPGQSLFTLSVDAQQEWMISATRADYDMDNLKLSQIAAEEVSAVYQLDYLILEGHCLDEISMQPPRSLQFDLGTQWHAHLFDTIVMANLGYFQLKASPGVWHLRLHEGLSKRLYQIVDAENTEPLPALEEGLIAYVPKVIDSFRSNIIRVRVSKKPDHLQESLLDESDEEKKQSSDGGLWQSISQVFKQENNASQMAVDKDATLNIFSLASGHLYERFLRIMMLTVIRNTQSKVKFWFLKNYISPQMRDFLPHMARNYGFEVELVQYQWPRWLHKQTEKQRIIWAYKILFLDVLFPLDVRKIIFVDADQTVRADLQELADLDLEGAPYGYTPFCDSRTEMDGFRFWRQGYWKSHLGDRPYHISALYVIDLARFRKLAAGDRLRGQYHSLSQDPNSLSNLDQDLPNNMIHNVPIKSLPQEWLWCETWCSDESKARAKTIDLCNNPLTKEPKLTAAARIVPEWTQLDDEIKTLQAKILPHSLSPRKDSTPSISSPGYSKDEL